MSTTETGNMSVSQYVPFTPFQESYAFESEASTLTFSEQYDTAPAVTPFVSEYAGVATESPETGELHDLLFQLYDQEFDEVLAEIAHEAWEAVTQRAEPFGEAGGMESAERFLQEWSEPVRREAETMLENVAQAVSEHDIASMSEAEIDRFFEQFEPRGTGLEQYFENFLGGLLNKAKALAKKGVELASKGMFLMPGLAGLIQQVKALAPKLLNLVLSKAMDQVPPTLRPYARQLAQRLLGTRVSEAEESEAFAGAPAAPDVSAAQQQFDLETAMLMFAADATEQEVLLNEAVYGAEREQGATVAQLQEARALFVDQLQAGVDPEQALEQFIPAVMAVLPIARTVIGVIGRKRVVNFLAKYLAGIVQRYVPVEAATKLSQVIVDSGLRLLRLEAPVEASGPRLANEAIAQTVEDTVRRVAELDVASFEEQSLLEAAVAEAFNEAAAENFPSEVIVPELQETSLRAMWVPMPIGRRRKYYKKYTNPFEIEITPQTAASIKTFGGTTLAAFLKDQLGVQLPVRAKVHLYQAIAGTTLPRIARFERVITAHGLGAKAAATQLHPLTVEAAGALLQHPKLGRKVSGQFLSSRGLVAQGARFYYLEIAGARPVTVTDHRGKTGVRRTSEVNVTLDFPKDEFRVFVYLSEADAQEIAGKVRKQDLTSVLVLAKRVYEAGVNVALGGDIQRHVKILTETLPQEQFLGLDLKHLTQSVKEYLIKKVVEWVGRGFASYLKSSAGEFVAATENQSDGVTVIVRIAGPPGAPIVRKLLRGEGIGIGVVKDLPSLFSGQPNVSAKTVAGFRFD
jgi:hypothetical protein